MNEKDEIELCANCGKRKATVNWLGHGSVMDYVHGNYSRWCEYCATEYQLKYAREQLDELPKRISELEEKFEKLKDG